MNAKKRKTKNIIFKRVKITKRGKILRRPIHQDHFNAKESGNKKRGKRGKKKLTLSDKRMVKKILK